MRVVWIIIGKYNCFFYGIGIVVFYFWFLLVIDNVLFFLIKYVFIKF